ncbi:hypothetical protein BO94DRAFT_533714 [Aspergillus sclerotioniger CBS 115572]|uniref:Vacuolar membrane-associated protein IML1 n=1 Tax=Aspergillus sclerotioniger CBS 115572 TaxID=1450535 RepID=A0A317X077_9EURO|nr:hypothetical protein BO94DRAFT_533714 [Aspergillus sclerotioniger CBS 115572]PWY91571.1 hypothetical protein BO94DRAFT_533714 [Aspergillus sclerotioniger CBS 115572]
MSLRGPMKRSHLRQVSAASIDTLSSSRTLELPPHGTPRDRSSTPDEKCSLWVHDETFSREEILDTGVQVGDIIEILPARFAGDAPHSAKAELGARSLRGSHVDLTSLLPADPRSKFKTPLQGRCLFVIKTRHSKLELSVTSSVANIFGFKNRSAVHISIVERAQCSASHYLVRSDMWRLRIVYKGQKIVFMGSIKATKTIPVFRSESAKYVLFIQMSREMWDFDAEGTGDILFSRVINGFLPELFKRWASSDARHLVTIVLFTRVEYDPSAIGPTSGLNTETLTNEFTPNGAPTRDFYRVVVNDMASGHWTTILDELKKDFRTFLRDVSILKATDDINTPTIDGVKVAPKAQSATIAGRPSSALRGNILEAIHLASSHLAYDHIDRDMVHTGTSIIVITPGSGVFEVSYESLASTTEALTNRGIAIDLVCLSPMPLHSVPLFKYREPVQKSPSPSYGGDIQVGGYSPEMRLSFASLASRGSHLSPKSALHSSFPGMSARHWSSRLSEWNYGIPHWLDISYWNPETYREARRILKKDPNAPIPFTVTKQSKVFVPRVRMYEIQMMGVMESEQSNISIPYLLEGQGVTRRSNPARGLNPASLSSVNMPLTRNTPFRHQLSDSLRPEPFLQNMASSKDTIFSKSRKSSNSALTWMDHYDEAVFQPFPHRRQRRKPPKQKRTSEPEVQVSNAHDRLSARSVTRLRENETNSSERAQSTFSAPRNIDATLSVPKHPVSTRTVSPKKPALKAPSATRVPRISRTISFALRASTEVNVEHAKGQSTSNPKKLTGMLTDSRSVDSLSISDSASTQTVIDLSSTPTTPQKLSHSSTITPSRPISIRVPQKQPSQDSEQGERPITESFSTTTTEIPIPDEARPESRIKRPNPRVTLTVNGGSRDTASKSPQSKALAPWVRSINPCNTPKDVLRDTSWFGRWQHAYPRPPHVAVVKWKSLKSPAILPLTTEEFPTASELASDYFQTPYRVFPNDDAEGIEPPKTRGVLIREMISLRLSHGFQIVVGKHVVEVSGQYSLEAPNVFDTHSLERDGATVFLSKGNTIHRLVCIDGAEIEVTRYTHRNSSVLASHQINNFTMYSPAMRTILSPQYEVKHIRLDSTMEEYNWNYADNYVAGHREYLFSPAQQLQFWRARYVLIPMHLQVNARRQLQSFNEDNEEEIHLLGINQLTHIWQRHKYVPPEEKLFDTSSKKREQNPLNIMYQTRNSSEVVAAELDRILLTDPGLDNSPAQLLPESELLERSSIGLSSLAQLIQGEKGVRMMDRRWHWRLHYNCFIGFELTTWLLHNFRDIDSREEAVEFGNELMKHGLFQHVEKRHNFRDGNYFYQISSEFRASRPESRGGWFPQIRPDKPIASTPAGDNPRDSPISGHSRSESLDEAAAQLKNKAAIMLSKTMKYDVDPRKRSNRPEVIDLHYDRLHNPDNCFHIELSWMNTTAKLIEDAKFGLKLVQTQPFRKPYRVQLKVPPPKGPPAAPDRHYFQKALLRKFDFVLDFEARSAFPADVEYIHRSGSLLAQITDEGDFLFLANRLVSTRTTPTRDIPRHERLERDQFRTRAGTYDPGDRLSPRLSPMARPGQPHILNGFVEFCRDPSHARPTSTRVEPTSLLETSIPSLELPASVVSHHITIPPGLTSRASHSGALPTGRSPRSGALRPLM